MNDRERGREREEVGQPVVRRKMMARVVHAGRTTVVLVSESLTTGDVV